MDDSPNETAHGDAGHPKVFICYAKDDAEYVTRLFEELKAAGADPWFDMHGLAPGDIWESEIRKAVRKADVFVPCLSPSFDAPGYRQVELRLAMKVAQRQPPGQGGFIIPFVLASCALPDWCEDIHAGDLSRPTTIKELLNAIEKHRGKLGSRGAAVTTPEIASSSDHRQERAVPQLPPEIVALIHHVQLDKAGWWQESVGRLVVSVLWFLDRPLSEAQVVDSLIADLQVNVPSDDVKAAIVAAKKHGDIVELPGPKYTLSEDCRRRFGGEVERLDKLERKVRDRFESLLREYCPRIDFGRVWTVFQESLLVPTVRQMGARIYDLFRGEHKDVAYTHQLDPFLSEFKSRDRPGLRRSVVAFLTELAPDTREYLCRYMTASFCVEAGNLSKTTLDRLVEDRLKPINFSILFDTNVLLAVLGLVGDAERQSLVRFMTVLKTLPREVEVDLRVLPDTVDETTRLLRAFMHKVDSLTTFPNLSREATEWTGDILTGYFTYCLEHSDRSVTPDEYFGPYIHNLITILEDKGIRLVDEATSTFLSNSSVRDDIQRVHAYQRQHPDREWRPAAAIAHDAVLWHYAAAHRPERIESPATARYWIVTFDRRMIRSDESKRRSDPDKMRICLEPGELLQLLQFWVARSADFDAVLVDSFTAPLLMREFDTSAENTTLLILQTLSRFEEARDLSPDVIKQIVMNEALRSRINQKKDEVQRVGLLQGTLAKQVQELTGGLDKAHAEIAVLSESVECFMSKNSALEDSINEREARECAAQEQASELSQRSDEQTREIRKLRDKAQDWETSVQEARAGREKIALQLEKTQAANRSLQQEWTDLRAAMETTRVRRTFALRAFALPASGILAVAASQWLLMNSSIGQVLYVAGVLGIFWLCAVAWDGNRRPEIQGWWAFQAFRKAYRFVVVAVGVGIIVKLLRDAGAEAIIRWVADRLA